MPQASQLKVMIADDQQTSRMLIRAALAELLGSALLASTVVGSGIAAQRLSPDDVGLQLLQNALVTGAVLVALILALGPVSAAFNPVVTLAERALGVLTTGQAALHVVVPVWARPPHCVAHIPLALSARSYRRLPGG